MKKNTTTTEPRIERGKILIDEVYKCDGFTKRVQKLKKEVIDAGTTIAGDRARWHLDSYLQTEGEPQVIRRAKAFANVLKNMPLVIRDGELIVGSSTPHVRGAHPAVEQFPIQLEHLVKQERQTAGSDAKEAALDEEDRKALLAEAQYWIKKAPKKAAVEAVYAKLGRKRLNNYAKTRMDMYGAPLIGSPHAILVGCDFEKYFRKGIKGIIAEVKGYMAAIKAKRPADYKKEDAEKMNFYEAVVITQEAMIVFANRYADLAREMAAEESDTQRKKELEEIAEVCSYVPENPARTFREALQAYHFVPVGHDIEKAQPNHYAARFDQYLFPYYKDDINEGRITRNEAAELLGCIFVHWSRFEPFLFGGLTGDRAHQKVAQANYIVNVTLGGIDRSGKDSSNELSCMVLQVAKEVKTHQPHISLRWHRIMAPELLDAAITCNRDHGGGIPAWFNDRTNIEYMLDRGVKLDDARDWSMSGCINTCYGKSFAWTWGPGPNFINHPKLLEITLNNGYDPVTGFEMGPHTGDPANMTWEEIVDAYKKQWKYFCDYYYDMYETMEPHFNDDQFQYSPFASAYMEDTLEKGKDCSRGGTRYWMELEGGNFVDRGITDTTDSLIAIKKVVYEDKTATMDEVLAALKANFKDHEGLRKKLMDAPKYGNDIDEPDDLASHLWSWTRDEELTYRDSFGRPPRIWRQGAAWATWAGEAVGALPNGRLAGVCLADAAVSPVQGCDKNGPTASLNSVAKMDVGKMESTLLNMKFTPVVLSSNEGKQKFSQLIGTYFDKGGSQIQINVLNKDTLVDAKKHPENYSDLVVRVAGYSAFWVELVPEVQDEIISRTDVAF